MTVKPGIRQPRNHAHEPEQFLLRVRSCRRHMLKQIAAARFPILAAQFASTLRSLARYRRLRRMLTFAAVIWAITFAWDRGVAGRSIDLGHTGGRAPSRKDFSLEFHRILAWHFGHTTLTPMVQASLANPNPHFASVECYSVGPLDLIVCPDD